MSRSYDLPMFMNENDRNIIGKEREERERKKERKRERKRE